MTGPKHLKPQLLKDGDKNINTQRVEAPGHTATPKQVSQRMYAELLNTVVFSNVSVVVEHFGLRMP